jgi:hypothetical protein
MGTVEQIRNLFIRRLSEIRNPWKKWVNATRARYPSTFAIKARSGGF